MKKTNKQSKKSNLISVVKNTAIVAVTSIAIVNTMLISATKIARAKNPSISIPTAPKFVLSKMVQSIENIGKNNIEETASTESSSESAVANNENNAESTNINGIQSAKKMAVSSLGVKTLSDTTTSTTKQEYNFSYTGSAQKIQLNPARYKIELWGARGGYGHGNSQPGKGGYTSGYMNVINTSNFYVFVGQAGNDNDSRRASWNGGAIGGYDNYGGTENGGSGGGETDIRYFESEDSNLLSYGNTNSINARFIIAGGGGGAGGWYSCEGYPGGGNLGNGTLLYGSAGWNVNSGGGGGGRRILWW